MERMVDWNGQDYQTVRNNNLTAKRGKEYFSRTNSRVEFRKS